MSGQAVYIGEQLVLQPAVGMISFLSQRKALLDHATAWVVYTSAGGQRKRFDLAGHRVAYGLARDSVNLSVRNEEVELTWQLALGDEALAPVRTSSLVQTQVRLRLEALNVGTHPVRVEELCVLDIAAKHGGVVGFAAPPRNWRFYQNGWQSWSPAFARHVTNGIWVNPNTADYRTKHVPHALPETRKVLSSEWFTVITPGREEYAARFASPEPALLLGFITAADQLAEIRLEVQDALAELRAVSYADSYLLSPGQKLSSEALVLAADDDELALLDLYATRLGEAMQARVPTQVPSGWCTWYYFFGEETADDVLANVKAAEKEQLPLDVILIDDGYENHIGDWLDVDTSKYPQGMKSIAQQIKSAGLRPGIWTAPFAASSSSRLYAEHPDWVLRDEKGEPVMAWQHWGVDIYALDLSLPAVQAWLQDIFRTLSEDWGFEFFKIDFLFAAALPGVHSSLVTGPLTRAQALRRGLEIIRAAIGDRFLLGCGAPLGPCVGIVDAMRIGTDVNVDWRPFWPDLSAPAASNAMLNSVTRSFAHGKLWLNDPDCLLLRPRGKDSNLSLHEMRMLTTVVGLSGGLVLDSDNLPSVPRSRLDYLRRVLPAYGHSAIPLDLFQHERPQRLALPIKTEWGSWTVAALLNWDGRPRVTRLSLSDLGLPSRNYHVYDYWRRRYLGTCHDEVVIEPHHPHEAVLLLFKPVSDKPQVLTSTFHITQGAVEIKSVRLLGNELIVEMEKAGKQSGQLLFAVPTEHATVKALVNGKVRQSRQVSPGIWEVSFTLSGKATVELLLG